MKVRAKTVIISLAAHNSRGNLQFMFQVQQKIKNFFFLFTYSDKSATLRAIALMRTQLNVRVIRDTVEKYPSWN